MFIILAPEEESSAPLRVRGMRREPQESTAARIPAWGRISSARRDFIAELLSGDSAFQTLVCLRGTWGLVQVFV